MKAVAFNGSPRKNGNTAGYISVLLKELESKGFETEVVNIAGKAVHGCTGCRKCYDMQNRRCVFNDDVMNSCFEKMYEADVAIIGSPVYFGNLTTETKALIDRGGMVNKTNGSFLKRKVGVAVSSVRRAGGLTVFNTINNFFLINGMIVPGSTYWNVGVAGAEGDFENDAEGLTTMRNLADNISWILRK